MGSELDFDASVQSVLPQPRRRVHDSNPFNGNPRGWLQGLGAVSILARFDGLIVHTRAACKRLRSYGIAAERVRRIPHGALAHGELAGLFATVEGLS